MHRAYQPVTPSTNKLLKQKWEEQYFEEHRKKVKEAKPMVDSKPPRTYMHLHLKLKKLQVEEERLATIERDNRILLEKMSQIMKTKGRVDNWNNYEAKSLNRTKRQQELLRVAHENQSILKRVLDSEPVYDHQKWEEDWQEKEAYMDSIARYPKDWHKKTGKKTSPKKNDVTELETVKKSGGQKTRASEQTTSEESQVQLDEPETHEEDDERPAENVDKEEKDAVVENE